MPSLLNIPQEWKDRLSDPDICRAKQEELDRRLAEDLGRQIEDKAFSPFLYKYRSIKYAVDMIENRHLKFSLVSEFGDPFDGRYIARNLTPEIAYNRLVRYTNDFNGASDEQVEMIKAMVAKEEILYACLDYMLQEQSGVFCSSVLPNSILMWAYYAQNHEGVCLKFDIRRDLKLFACSRNVNYQEKLPVIDFFSNPHDYESFWDCILNKEQNWMYEMEMRTIKRHFHGFRHFAPHALSAVIFGVKTLPRDKEKIREALDMNGLSHVQLCQADIDTHRYLIHIRNL